MDERAREKKLRYRIKRLGYELRRNPQRLPGPTHGLYCVVRNRRLVAGDGGLGWYTLSLDDVEAWWKQQVEMELSR